jgi:hypothetical protein
MYQCRLCNISPYSFLMMSLLHSASSVISEPRYENISPCWSQFLFTQMLHVLRVNATVMILSILINSSMSLPTWSKRVTLSYNSNSNPANDTMSSDSVYHWFVIAIGPIWIQPSYPSNTSLNYMYLCHYDIENVARAHTPVHLSAGIICHTCMNAFMYTGTLV